MAEGNSGIFPDESNPRRFYALGYDIRFGLPDLSAYSFSRLNQHATDSKNPKEYYKRQIEAPVKTALEEGILEEMIQQNREYSEKPHEPLALYQIVDHDVPQSPDQLPAGVTFFAGFTEGNKHVVTNEGTKIPLPIEVPEGKYIYFSLVENSRERERLKGFDLPKPIVMLANRESHEVYVSPEAEKGLTGELLKIAVTRINSRVRKIKEVLSNSK